METSGKFVFKKVSSAPRANQVKSLADYLAEQENILNQLEKVIALEYSALKNRELRELQPLSTQKSDLMLKLQANDQKIKLHQDVALLKTTYSAKVLIIKNKMKKCHFRNEINGKLINLCIQTSNKMRSMFVSARDMVTRNMTYNCKGSATARAPLRVSVSA